ncbi:MAG: glycosyltransferase [Bacteroidetes bacterium]|jgi:biofilm PGA synthesis N-glycosyltransferase PgaC|nr:glycosyltransferase [Bacteroidota bacterium]
MDLGTGILVLAASLGLLAGLAYAAYLAAHLLGWLRLRRYPAAPPNAIPPISILVPARNEGQNLGACLAAVQQQPGPWEVWVIDDESEDDTYPIARAFAQADSRIQVLRSKGGKKQALSRGIQAARHAWIVTLDADCVAGSTWLCSLAAYLQPGCSLVAGPVQLAGSGPLARLLAAEQAGLMVLSGGAFGLGCPGMSNGGNLAFRKTAWESVGGYTAHAHLSSGDDMLLLQQLVQAGHQVAYCPLPGAAVRTQPPAGLAGLAQQRRRWLSKSRAYRNPLLTGGALGLLGFWLFLPALLWWHPSLALLLWGAKAGLELSLCVAGRSFGSAPGALRAFPLLQLLQPLYVLWAGAQQLRPRAFSWKNRVLR